MRVQWYAYLVFTLLLIGCKARYEELFVQIKLTDNWEFKNTSDAVWHKASVPGDIISETSKIKGLGERWFLNTDQLNNILTAPYEYRNTFEISKEILAKDSVDIVFPGIRGAARIYINDSLLSGQMFNEIAGYLSCKRFLRVGKNELRIVFDPLDISKLLGNKDKNYINPKNEIVSLLIKGLDNLPFRNIPNIPGLIEAPCLTAWSNVKIEDVYFYPLTVTEKTAQYNAEINIMASKETEVNLEISVDSKSVIKLSELKLKQGINKQIVSFTIANPKLWWTNGMGQQYLYNVNFRLVSSNQLAHEMSYPLGARKLEVIYEPDSINKPLNIMLNGHSIFLKGGIVDIPRNLNPSEVKAIYQQIVDNFKTANVNLVRLLHLNFYRADLFYKLCSENGILIWQDFSVSKEVNTQRSDKFNYLKEQSVKYLRNMPSCAIYMGKVEGCFNDHRSVKTNKAEQFIEKELPLTIKKYDNRTFYWALRVTKEGMTPHIDACLSKSLGLCDAYGIVPSSYTSSLSFMHFANNLGFPTTELLSKMHSPGYLDTVRSVNPDFAQNIQQISKSYPHSLNLESAFYLSQLYQANQVKQYIENYRLKSENCIGFTNFEIHDFSPRSAGSSIDFLGQAKPAYYTLRDSYAANVLIARDEGTSVNVYAVNDDLKDLDAILLCKMIDFYGNPYFVKQVPVRITANSKVLLLTLSKKEILSTLSPNKVALLLQLNQPGHTSAQNMFYFAEPKFLELPKTNIKVDINQNNRGYSIILKSNVFVKNLCMETDRPDTRFSDNNIDLLPGKRYKILVFYKGSRDDLVKNLVIKSLNNFSVGL